MGDSRLVLLFLFELLLLLFILLLLFLLLLPEGLSLLQLVLRHHLSGRLVQVKLLLVSSFGLRLLLVFCWVHSLIIRFAYLI